MELLPLVRQLEGTEKEDRFRVIVQQLEDWCVPYQIHTYATGKNIVVTLPSIEPNKATVGVSAHYDVVPYTPGANDNASSIAVCLSLIAKFFQQPLQHLQLKVIIFDEEETGLEGSKAYVSHYDVKAWLGLLNLEMVGQGNQLALWSLSDLAQGALLTTLEKTSQAQQIPTYRFDGIVTNVADHISFREAGLEEAFTLTCVSEEDIAISTQYYQAQAMQLEKETLWGILSQAPLFQHYHQPTDISVHLSEDSLQLVTKVVEATLHALDKKL